MIVVLVFFQSFEHWDYLTKGIRELILVSFVRLFDLRLFRFVYFCFLLVSGKGLWHSLDFSFTFFDKQCLGHL